METTANISSIKRLERPIDGRILAGVSAGLGRYFDLSPAFYRLGFVVLTLLGGAGILVYLAAALVIPEEGKEQSVAADVLAGRRDRPWPLVGLTLVGAALAVLLARVTLSPVSGSGWVLVLLIGLGVLWVSRGKTRRRRILLAGVVSSASMLALAFAAVAVAFSWFNVSLSDGVGTRVYQPVGATSLQPTYEIGVGKLRVDLSHIGTVSQPTHIRAKVGVGELQIVLPPGLPVNITSHAKVGDLSILGSEHSGRDLNLTTADRGSLVIDASVGAGDVRVTRSAQ
jgi:phage shock protein PspC (stress-responsive transcriptional regulator)